ncbi:HlyD family efflux transporter periplasmic adaptor subunit [Methylobacterium sp. WSM2598]|uniref:HlyD family efflux transporter periplasmic adaptor subunit n=1 Tax=Methylobacterium sp. WSM2598 TaxID=398261 RepID=UPI000476EB4E|nr:HlyD family secretion protein [Methylobacterium sp. WSM2598]
MTGIEASDVLRIAVISGLIGFGVFCASFSLAVWFRRNRAKPNRPARLSFLALVLGIFGAAGNWAYNEFSSRTGIVGGQDLFVVHAKRNVTTDKLAPEGRIEQGERLIEFLPPAIDGQLAVIDSHIKQSEAKIAYFNLRALPVDSMLLQRQAQLRQQIDQAKQMLLDIQKSRREAERAQLDAQTQYAEKISQSDLQGAAEKQALATAASQIEIATSAASRAENLHRTGTGTLVAVEDRTATLLNYTLSRNRAQANLASLEKYRSALDQSYGRTLKSLAIQISKLDGDMSLTQQTMDGLNWELAKIEKAVTEDRARAADATAREREAAVHELEGLKAERVALLSATQVKAPFSGEIVYRHPAPGFAPESTPVLAVSKGSGFVARVWVPTGDLDALKREKKVQLALEQPILNRFFEGSYRSYEEAPYEKNRVIAHFDAKLPLEAITLLASAGNPVQVKLLWRPDLTASFAFQCSLALMTLGCIGAVTCGLRRAPADVPAVAHHAPAHETQLREMARDLHKQLRDGTLDEDPDLARGVVHLVERMGEPVVDALREEIVFDEEFERALSRHRDDPALMGLINKVRNAPLTIQYA